MFSASFIALVVFASAGCAQEVTVDLKNQFITEDMQTLVPHIGGRVLAKTLPAHMPKLCLTRTNGQPSTLRLTLPAQTFW